jgi:hypothetical protein
LRAGKRRLSLGTFRIADPSGSSVEIPLVTLPRDLQKPDRSDLSHAVTGARSIAPSLHKTEFTSFLLGFLRME